MNKFEIAKTYNSLSPVDFLRVLLSDESIQKIPEIIQYINQLLKKIRDYAKYATISAIKGLNPFHKSSSEDVSPDYYDYTKTPDFNMEMKGLFNRLGINDNYFSQTYQDMYDILAEYFKQDEDILKSVELTREGYFKFTDKEEKEIIIMSNTQYEDMLAYMQTDEYLKTLNSKEACFDTFEDKYHFVYAKNPIVEKYMAKSILDRQVNKEEDKQEDKEPVNTAKSETAFNEHVEYTPILTDAEIGKWHKLDVNNDRDLKEALFLKDNKALKNIDVKFTFSPMLAVDFPFSHVIVRLPGKMKQDGLYKEVATTMGINSHILIPKKMLKQYKNNVYECALNLADSFNVCDKDGNILYLDEDKTKPYTISGLSVADKFVIKQLRENAEPNNNAKYLIDGKEMDIVRTESGYRMAISKAEKRAVILEYNGTDKDITIPESIKINSDTYIVDEIKENAFIGKNIEHVTLPRTIKEICCGAFGGCYNLRSITLNEGLQRIAERVFEGCESLENIKIPNSIREIGEGAFNDCNIRQFYMDKNNDSVGIYNDSFLVSNGILIKASEVNVTNKKITLPDIVDTIGSHAFEKFNFNADKVTTNVCLDLNNTLVIKDSAFMYANINEVVAKNVKKIGPEAFYKAYDLKKIEVPNTEIIKEKAFASTSVMNVDLKNVKEICPEAFANNAVLKDITLDASKINKDKYFDNAFIGTNVNIKWENLSDEQEQILSDREDKFKPEPIAGYSNSEVKKIANDFIIDVLKERKIENTDIKMEILPSDYKEVVAIIAQIKGSGLSEKELYRLINDNKCIIDNVQIHITPITQEESGSLEQWISAYQDMNTRQLPNNISSDVNEISVNEQENSKSHTELNNTQNTEVTIPRKENNKRNPHKLRKKEFGIDR